MKNDLAGRAVACTHWRWMPGMLIDVGDDRQMRLFGRGPNGCWNAHTCSDGRPINAGLDVLGGLPVLDDPAALGCMHVRWRERLHHTRGRDGGGGVDLTGALEVVP